MMRKEKRVERKCMHQNMNGSTFMYATSIVVVSCLWMTTCGLVNILCVCVVGEGVVSSGWLLFVKEEELINI
jgi:hypothetical protein